MHDYLLSVLLGIVEGLTEFLPVSSTAHLRIVEALCHLDLHSSFWKMYTIVIQLGAILALPVFFRSRILDFLRTFPKGRARRSHFADASVESDAHRIRRHSNPGVGPEKTNRPEFGEPPR